MAGSDWNAAPDHPERVSRGNAWVRARRTACLRVPFAIIVEEENVLINPDTPVCAFAIQHVRPFVFEPRLLR